MQHRGQGHYVQIFTDSESTPRQGHYIQFLRPTLDRALCAKCLQILRPTMDRALCAKCLQILRPTLGRALCAKCLQNLRPCTPCTLLNIYVGNIFYLKSHCCLEIAVHNNDVASINIKYFWKEWTILILYVVPVIIKSNSPLHVELKKF